MTTLEQIEAVLATSAQNDERHDSRRAVGDAREEAAQLLAAAERAGGDPLELARQRANGTPLAFLTGRTRFMNVELLSDDGALVPREETEILGRAALDRLRQLADLDPERELRVVDMCCGAGNLACALATHVPRTRIWAADLTDGCVALARRNVRHLGLDARVSVHQGDLFGALDDLELEGTLDVLVCNPPYISTGRLEKERAELLEHEPREAFDGGPYGLSVHQRVLKEGHPFLREPVSGTPVASLLLEFGLGQEKQVELLFKRLRKYGQLEWFADPSGNARAVGCLKQPAN